MTAHAAAPAGPVMPPRLNGRAVAPGTDPLLAARDGFAKGELGAGDIMIGLDERLVDFAIVLEPEEPLAAALQVVPIMMVAIADALGAIGPPKLGIHFRWPAIITANGAEFGTLRAMALPEWSSEVVPDALLLAVRLRLDPILLDVAEPGNDVRRTALWLEGAGDLSRTMIVESVTRHFLAVLDGWQHDGFGDVHRNWMLRSEEVDGPFEWRTPDGSAAGTMIGLDEAGGALVKTADGVRLITLADALGMDA